MAIVTATAIEQTTKPRSAARSDLVRALGARLRVEAQVFVREPSTIFFGFAFPIIIFVIFASIFTEVYQLPDGSTFTAAYLYLAGMVAMSAMTAGFQDNLGSITTDREDGTLRRLYCSPMPRSAYMAARLSLVMINASLQVVVLLLIAHFGFDVALPQDWLTFAWVLLLGIASCTAVGIALSGLLRSARAATTVAAGLTNVLGFLSGLYVPVTTMPETMLNVAKLFPPYWIARAMRSVLLPDQFKAVETGQTWQTGWAAIVLGLWLVAGLLVAVRTFRWDPTVVQEKRS